MTDPAIVAPLEMTDPEFAALFRNFAFSETLRHVDLDDRDRLTYQSAAAIAVGAVAEYGRLTAAALDAGVTPVQVKEVVYQSVAYVGMARGSDFIDAANGVLTARGVPLPLPGRSTTTPETRVELGLAKQKEIVGADTVDTLYSSTSGDTLHFQEFLSGNCFGDLYTRGGLDVTQRELITFALIAALGGADSQVESHVTANLRVGNTRKDLIDVLTVLVAYIGYPRTLNALAHIDTAAPAAETKETR